MKKHVLSTLLLALAATCFAQETTISGTWKRGAPLTLSLYSVELGWLERIDTFRMDEGRTFSFTFTPSKEKFYVVGTGAPVTRLQKLVFYLKPGDRLNVAVNDTSYTLVGENTQENVAMAAWHNHILRLERMAAYPPFRATYIDFFPRLDKVGEGFKPTSTGNSAFNQQFTNYRKFDIMSLALEFLKMPRTQAPENADYPDYYRNLSVAEVSKTTDILKYPFGLLSGVAFIESRLHGIERSNLIEHVQNDTIKGEIFLSDLARVKDIATMEQLVEMYGQYIITDGQQTRFQKEKERINIEQMLSNVGEPGHNFTYVDVNGNKVSFSDFKGKVVYIDVWATWCGPCRAEIPHLKRLKEHFKDNKDMLIVGISSDKPSDLQKWKNFVAEHQLEGIQLWGGVESDENIMKLYSIRTIPRFFLFDKEGKIVSADAPRASSPEIIPLLTRLLQ